MIKLWKADPVTYTNDMQIFEVVPIVDTSDPNCFTISRWINNQLLWDVPVHIVQCPDSIFLTMNHSTKRLEAKSFGLDVSLTVRLGNSIQLYIIEQV